MNKVRSPFGLRILAFLEVSTRRRSTRSPLGLRPSGPPKTRFAHFLGHAPRTEEHRSSAAFAFLSRHHNFNTVILFIAEHLVGLGRGGQIHPVRNYE